MQAVVFTDEALRGHAGRFVWLEIDTEKAQNAPFRDKFDVPALPTYFVLEPETEQVLLKWVGSATVMQFVRLLDDASTNFARVRSAGAAGAAAVGPVSEADSLLTRADLLYGEGKNPEAAAAYEQALAAAPAGWRSYRRAVEGLLIAWSIDGEYWRAAALAREVLPRVAATTSVAVVAGVGLDCAVQLPEDDAAKKELVPLFERAVRAALADTSLAITDDDRSGLHISLLSAREAAGDSAGERAAAVEWAAFLDTAAARARTPEARAVFDSHRLSAYLELGQAEKAVDMLLQSERDFPQDYNPPARLALAYKALQRWDEAIAASDRAVARGYGPRLLGILRTRSDLFAAKGDTAAARAVLADALQRAAALPEDQRSERTIEGLRKRLAELGGPSL
ncbi:MAG: thioredoxin family protein [Candidatus Eiseniibacteriota bacterium]